MSDGMVRVGFLGTGGIARWGHFGHLSKWPDVKLAAFCDVNAEAAGKAAQEFGGKAYTDPQAMLRDEALDALYVCVPPFAHGEAEIQAAAGKIALFVEKPLGVDLAFPRRVRDAIAKAGAVSAVGYNWRAADITGKAQALLAGKPVSAAFGYWVGGMPGVMWWRQQAQSGGQLNEQATHVVDVARCLIGGKVVRVYAQGAKGICAQRVEKHDVHDNAVALLTFDNGCVCAIGSGHLSPQGFRVGLDLILDGMTLSHNNSELRVKHEKGEEVYRCLNKPYEAEDRAFIDAVKRGDPRGVICSYAEAFETHRVTMAANESMRTGKVVEIE